MSRFFRWVVALVGPILLISILYLVHVLGTGLHAAKVSARVGQALADHPLDPVVLDGLKVLFDGERSPTRVRTAARLLELGTLIENKQYDKFIEQLSTPRAGSEYRLSVSTIEELKSLAQAEIDSPTPEKELLLREKLILLVQPHLIPPISILERGLYNKARSILGTVGYQLPELPQSESFSSNSTISSSTE